MKKIMLIAAAAAGLVAMADGVESGVVGYNTVTIDKQYTIMGINFTDTDGNNIPLQKALPYTEGMTKGANISSADQIQVMNATGGYDIYYMSNGKNAKGATISGLEGNWAASGKFVVSDATLAPGSTFWYIRNAKEAEPFTITVAGGVSALASYDTQINIGYKLISNPYPVELDLNENIRYVAGMTKGANISAADSIQIMNATGGYDIYYMSNGKNAKGATISGLEGKWAASGKFVVAEDAKIPVGKGAWYIRKGNTDFTITITKPYDL